MLTYTVSDQQLLVCPGSGSFVYHNILKISFPSFYLSNFPIFSYALLSCYTELLL